MTGATASMSVAASGPAARVRGPRAVPGRLVAAWAALLFNVLAFAELPTLVPIPHVVGQLLTQGSLVLALLLAFVVNPRGVLRPNLFLVLLTMLGVVCLMVSIHSVFLFGSAYRAFRLVGFLAVLWLLTPWWGRRDMLLLRCHRACLWAVVGMVLVGAALAPGVAFSFDGRLAGVLWPVPATQVAHYAAVLFGTSTVLWLCRVTTGRGTVLALAVSGIALILTHTRTALAASLVGILVAGASLFLGHARVRRVSAWGAVGGVLAATVFASGLRTWLLRGQTTQEASQLTGRTEVWSAVFGMDRPKLAELFGSGLSDQSFNGLPIDSNWVATFLDQGWFGIVVEIAVLLLLLLMAATRERGPQRATALFLVVYCIFASFTETGLGTPSPYVLDLAVAASLLVPEARRPGAALARVRPHALATVGPTKAAPTAEDRPGAPSRTSGRLVNINTASRAELRTLPGVGRRTADEIVQWRTESGPFTEIPQLLRVHGISEARLLKVAPLVTLEEEG